MRFLKELFIVLNLSCLAFARPQPPTLDTCANVSPVSQVRGPEANGFNTQVQQTDTEAIQSAIDACSVGGGGRVILAPGRFHLTFTVFLRSNVNLHLSHGTTVHAPLNRDGYGFEKSSWYAFVAINETNVGITGESATDSVIDGNAQSFIVERNEKKHIMVSWNETGGCSGDQCRPRLVGFIRSSDIYIKDVKLNEPAFWCLNLYGCDRVTISGIYIYGDFNIPNNDGIDIISSRNVHISDCNIDVGDDAICPKTQQGFGPTENVIVTGCTIRSKSSAVKFGSTTYDAFRNLVFSNLVILESFRGLAVQVRDDGGDVEGVVFSNIIVHTRLYDPSWWGQAEPIYVTTTPRDGPSQKVGAVKSIRFSNIDAYSENGIFIAGALSSPIENIVIDNVRVFLECSTNYTAILHDYRPSYRELEEYPAIDGIYMEHVRDATLRGVEVHWPSQQECDSRTREAGGSRVFGNAVKTLPGSVRRLRVDGFEEFGL